jgi:hypothetical protein
MDSSGDMFADLIKSSDIIYTQENVSSIATLQNWCQTMIDYQASKSISAEDAARILLNLMDVRLTVNSDEERIRSRKREELKPLGTIFSMILAGTGVEGSFSVDEIDGFVNSVRGKSWLEYWSNDSTDKVDRANL